MLAPMLSVTLAAAAFNPTHHAFATCRRAAAAPSMIAEMVDLSVAAEVLVVGGLGLSVLLGGDKPASTIAAPSSRLADLKRDGAAIVQRRASVAQEFEQKWKIIAERKQTSPSQELIGKVVPTQSSNMEELFQSFDKDNSGSLDADELRQALEATGQRSDLQAVGIRMAKLDSNEDGVVSMSEFSKRNWWEESPNV